MRFLLTRLGTLALLLGVSTAATADADLFDPADHCVAYRTVKDMWFFVDTRIVGKSCQVTASLVAASDGGDPRISVSLPIESLDSGNGFRDGAVADLLGAETQPDLRFTSAPLEAEALGTSVASGRFTLSGSLSFGGQEFPVEFPVELTESGGRHYATGILPTSFATFGIEVPTVAAGLIARPHEAVELGFQIELERVVGLEAWAEQQNLSAESAE